ncbi:MAG: PAS domain-containing protein [Candidatus Aminicenantes bacterium]|nr:PAS domain-containing protein [Candidatus Aminicenantes bacterium]
MNFLPFLHFFVSMAYFYMGCHIFVKNRRDIFSRITFVFFLVFGVWAFALAFVHDPNSTKNTARLAINISSVAWVGFGSFYLGFMLVFTGKKRILKNAWLYLFLFGIPLALIYAQWCGYILVDYIKLSYGWKPVYGESVWVYLFFLYCTIFMGAGFYLNLDFTRKAQLPGQRKQAEVILIITVITFSLGTVTDIILPFMKIHVIPNTADISAFVYVVGVVYAMIKYKFLAITPLTAADNIISTMHDSLILLNMKGEIVFVNRAAAILMEYEEEELKRIPQEGLFPRRDGEEDSPLKILKKGSTSNEEYVCRTKKGREIPVLFSSSILKDEKGSPAGIVCVVRDISERKKLKEETLKSKKLESVGLLAGGIAHDFNNLLSIITMNITLVRDLLDPDEKAYKFLGKAQESSAKAAHLAGKFITFAPGGHLMRKEITLPAVLESVQWPGLLTPGIAFDTNIPGALKPLYGDEEQLVLLLKNLFLNAVEAMPEGGEIRFSAENVTIAVESKLLLQKGQYVKIIFADTGAGISPANIEKIFDPYFTTKGDIRKGMGLGLTTCYSIVQKHGGHISAASREGEGATVMVYLPTA